MKLCIIPARSGSKRIVDKNIKLFQGKPIIGYSIETAQASDCFDKIIVSTDDEKIAAISRDYGAETPFIRPKDLADDFTGTMPVISHAIRWYIEQNIPISIVCCLYATAPFVTTDNLLGAYQKLLSTDADYCFSVTKYHFPIQRAIKVTLDDRITMFDQSYLNTRSQDLEEAYHDAGQFYWGKAKAFLAEKSLFSEYATPYIIPSYQVQDIDTLEDWIRAEHIFSVMKATESCWQSSGQTPLTK